MVVFFHGYDLRHEHVQLFQKILAHNHSVIENTSVHVFIIIVS